MCPPPIYIKLLKKFNYYTGLSDKNAMIISPETETELILKRLEYLLIKYE